MKLLALSCVLAFGFAGCSASNTLAQTETPARAALSQAELDYIVAANPLFAGSVVIARDGQIIAQSHVGMADTEHHIANSADTFHSLASVGKMFTATSIAQLVENGRFGYDTPVSDLISELAGQMPTSVTVDNLLHHTSGLPRIDGVSDAEIDAARTNSDIFNLLLTSGIETDGPAAFAYRNENYFILGEIVERVSGQSYESYVHDHISVPAGMTGPLFVRRDEAGDRLVAQPYLPVDYETWWNSEDDIEPSGPDAFVHLAPVASPTAGGGAYVTAAGMLRFAVALRDESLISPDSFAGLCALDEEQTIRGRGYARGCAVSLSDHGVRFGHTGSGAGVHARFFMYPEAGIDVVVLSNHELQAGPVFDAIDAVLRPE